jgi:glycosyltransferase involved in cell wall biosynthesis
MRIAIVAQNLVYGDGQGRINLEIARCALRAGASVTLVSVVVDPELLELGARWEQVKVPRKPILARVALFPPLANRVIDRLRKTDQIDCVIANGYTLTRGHDVNLSQFVHGAWLKAGVVEEASRGLIQKIYQAFYTRYNAWHEKRSFAAAAAIVAPSARTAEEVHNLGIDPAKIHVVPNGVNCEEFSPGSKDRAALGLPEAVPLALFAGDIRTNRKGLGSVLQGMVNLPEAHLAVIGRADGSPFVQMAEELKIADRVHFLGFRKDVPAVMRACDLFVFPSWYDPFGLVITEALACGLPVVTTAATGAGELLTPECGSIVKHPADIAAITAAMKQWLGDPAKRAAAASACRAIAQANGWEAMANRYLELLPSAKTARHEAPLSQTQPVPC